MALLTPTGATSVALARASDAAQAAGLRPDAQARGRGGDRYGFWTGRTRDARLAAGVGAGTGQHPAAHPLQHHRVARRRGQRASAWSPPCCSAARSTTRATSSRSWAVLVVVSSIIFKGGLAYGCPGPPTTSWPAGRWCWCRPTSTSALRPFDRTFVGTAHLRRGRRGGVLGTPTTARGDRAPRARSTSGRRLSALFGLYFASVFIATLRRTYTAPQRQQHRRGGGDGARPRGGGPDRLQPEPEPHPRRRRCCPRPRPGCRGPPRRTTRLVSRVRPVGDPQRDGRHRAPSRDRPAR